MLEIFDLAPKDRLIMQLLMSQGLVSGEVVREAMARCTDSPFFSLVEVLIGNGSVTLEGLESLLRDYCAKLRLGELAIAHGLISEEQLKVAMEVQNLRNTRIGEIFVELHLATQQQIDMLLDFQLRCRKEPAAC
ncbi:MAG TPA: hypothetical protein V6D47_15965 [Oscillatoriaceae cyanobacterium]